jgi:parallel beta-helix repeat protein
MAAIYLYTSSNNNKVIGNNITLNGGDAIRIGKSSSNLIANNIIWASIWYGISLFESCNNNIIVNNSILSTNREAIYLYESSNNKIYHNDINNQAFDDMNNNLWNNTYSLGGNYWGAYSPTCQDLFDGAATPQATGSPDGICDSPYYIDADSVDYYPLTSLPDVPPTIEVLEPGGSFNQIYAQEDLIIIAWNANDDKSLPINPINITYGTPGNWTTIATLEPNDGIYSWDTALVPCPGTYWMNISV